VSNFIVQALHNEPITLYGDGVQTRSFCYVSDLIAALVRFLDTPDDVTGPLNLGNPDEYSMRELAEQICDLTNSRSPIVHRPLPFDDPRRRRPDIAAARRLLDWEPRTGLRDGLARTIEYFDALLAGRAPAPLAPLTAIRRT
jgi:UDP-glucuronate decarboxylase